MKQSRIILQNIRRQLIFNEFFHPTFHIPRGLSIFLPLREYYSVLFLFYSFSRSILSFTGVRGATIYMMAAGARVQRRRILRAAAVLRNTRARARAKRAEGDMVRARLTGSHAQLPDPRAKLSIYIMPA